MLHHGVPPPPEPSPPTLDSDGYLDVLDDEDAYMSMSSKEEEEEPLSPCGPLQAALIGPIETAHRESSMRVVRAIVLEQTNAAITNHVGKISVEFTAAKESAAKRLMSTER
jgi:hypothetical protein